MRLAPNTMPQEVDARMRDLILPPEPMTGTFGQGRIPEHLQ
jgi:hypothetical protein